MGDFLELLPKKGYCESLTRIASSPGTSMMSGVGKDLFPGVEEKNPVSWENQKGRYIYIEIIECISVEARTLCLMATRMTEKVAAEAEEEGGRCGGGGLVRDPV